VSPRTKAAVQLTVDGRQLTAREGDFTVIASFHMQAEAAHAAGHLLTRLKSAA